MAMAGWRQPQKKKTYKTNSKNDVGVARGTVFQEIRPRTGFKTGDFVKSKVGGGLLP